LDCSKDDLLTEQSHKAEVDINNIVRKYAGDVIRKTADLMSQEYRFDDVTGNDFQEAMQKVTKASSLFESMPVELRKKFDNSVAKYLDFIQNPDNINQMVEMGLAEKRDPVKPVQVQVVDPVTPPPADGGAG